MLPEVCARRKIREIAFFCPELFFQVFHGNFQGLLANGVG